MREIKFRAWHIEQEKMFCVESLHLEDEYYVLNDGDIYSDTFCVKTGDIELMQFTGLTDKNGAEIYEGDIVEFASHWDKHVCTVSFSKCRFGFGREIKGELGINDDCDLSSFMNGSGCKGYTVIGNVHQNPELWEQNDE